MNSGWFPLALMFLVAFSAAGIAAYRARRITSRTYAAAFLFAYLAINLFAMGYALTDYWRHGGALGQVSSWLSSGLNLLFYKSPGFLIVATISLCVPALLARRRNVA